MYVGLRGKNEDTFFIIARVIHTIIIVIIIMANETLEMFNYLTLLIKKPFLRPVSFSAGCLFENMYVGLRAKMKTHSLS